jgi:hypothetical protein
VVAILALARDEEAEVYLAVSPDGHNIYRCYLPAQMA